MVSEGVLRTPAAGVRRGEFQKQWAQKIFVLERSTRAQICVFVLTKAQQIEGHNLFLRDDQSLDVRQESRWSGGGPCSDGPPTTCSEASCYLGKCLDILVMSHTIFGPVLLSERMMSSSNNYSLFWSSNF